MPYYCTVPRCTSMAGKTKNVSFHQFPRDEELAELWNKILKRGKPYTKYSKVCSLHFTSDDYTITSGQRNKGQWRTLRKDAIPSQNLPAESPVQHTESSYTWTPPPIVIDPRMHQQMAQAIYVQTMLAMQAAGITALSSEPSLLPSVHIQDSEESKSNSLFDSNKNSKHALGEQSHQKIDTTQTNSHIEKNHIQESLTTYDGTQTNSVTFKCIQCSKCFKDRDVFILHKRTHVNDDTDSSDEMLRANPILANLLKSDTPARKYKSDTQVNTNEQKKNDLKSVNNIESQMMTALTANMQNYLRNLSTIMTCGSKVDTLESPSENRTSDSKDGDSSNCDNKDLDALTGTNLVPDEDAS